MNNVIFFFLYSFAHKSFLLDEIVIFFASYFPFVVVFGAGIFLLFHHEVFKAENSLEIFLQKKKEILSVFGAGVLAWILAYVLKLILQTERPFNLFNQVMPLIKESGHAMPSGHATFFMALAMAIFFSHKKAGYVFIIFALLIGVARIMAGVHFPLDILGGFLLGGIVSYLVAYFIKSV